MSDRAFEAAAARAEVKAAVEAIEKQTSAEVVVALRCRQTAFDRNLVERLLFEHGAQTVAWKVLDL